MTLIKKIILLEFALISSLMTADKMRCFAQLSFNSTL